MLAAGWDTRLILPWPARRGKARLRQNWPSEWRVETARGATRFLLKSEDDVCPLDDHRALVTDANGIRYLIPDLRQLDATSRRLLERFL
jgi:hypothetical protein